MFHVAHSSIMTPNMADTDTDSKQTASAPTMGRRLASLRALRGFTQEQAAERAGLSQSYLSDLENDRSPSTPVQTVARLADVYDSTLDYVVNGSEAA
jgi:transcriptional regulator with XRE-family HTH domain